MAASNRRALALFALTVAGPHLLAAATPAREEITLDATSFEADLHNNSLIYRKVRIAQGEITISAEMGQTTNGNGQGLAFDNSLWVFRGNVKLTTQDSLLTSDDAEINFSRKALAKAIANGKPALFEQRIAKTGKVAHGRADTIDYDAVKGVVRLSKNAWLTDGQTEISNDSLRYNVLTQSIIAEGSDQGSQRVHIIITPPPSKP